MSRHLCPQMLKYEYKKFMRCILKSKKMKKNHSKTAMRYSNRLSRWILLVMLTGVFPGISISSLAQKSKPQIQSIFIYGVARQIDWKSNSEELKIGVISNKKELVTELKNLSITRKINGKTIKVEVLSSSDNVLDHDIVLITSDSKDQLQNCLTNASLNTLVMTEFPGAVKRGSHLNFISVGSKIAFELNKTAISKTNLNVSSALAQLASNIN